MASTNLRILLCFIGVFVAVRAHDAANTLVLLDNLAIRETHSLFFKGLQGKNARCRYTHNAYTSRVVVVKPTDVSIDSSIQCKTVYTDQMRTISY